MYMGWGEGVICAKVMRHHIFLVGYFCSEGGGVLIVKEEVFLNWRGVRFVFWREYFCTEWKCWST